MLRSRDVCCPLDNCFVPEARWKLAGVGASAQPPEADRSASVVREGRKNNRCSRASAGAHIARRNYYPFLLATGFVELIGKYNLLLKDNPSDSSVFIHAEMVINRFICQRHFVAQKFCCYRV